MAIYKKCLFNLLLLVMCHYTNSAGASEARATQAQHQTPFDIEENFEEEYRLHIAPNFSQGKAGKFVGANGVEIAYASFQPSSNKDGKGIVVISSGRTESYIKYAEIIYHLGREGYTVYIHDHRGQGFSGRIVQADTQLGHVEDFDLYVDDLETFIDQIVLPEAGQKKIFLLGHSMGGAVAALYAARNTAAIDAMALVSPMMEPRFPVSGFDETRLVCAITAVSSVFLPATYISGQGSYDAHPVAFENNDLTHSESRYKKSLQIFDEKQNQAAKIGGPSRKWVREACKGSAHALESAREIKIPVLIIQAGADTAVHNEAQKHFCDLMNTGASAALCQTYILPGARHAIFMESDQYRTPALLRILEFFSKNRS